MSVFCQWELDTIQPDVGQILQSTARDKQKKDSFARTRSRSGLFTCNANTQQPIRVGGDLIPLSCPWELFQGAEGGTRGRTFWKPNLCTEVTLHRNEWPHFDGHELQWPAHLIISIHLMEIHRCVTLYDFGIHNSNFIFKVEFWVFFFQSFHFYGCQFGMKNVVKQCNTLTK